MFPSCNQLVEKWPMRNGVSGAPFLLVHAVAVPRRDGLQLGFEAWTRDLGIAGCLGPEPIPNIK